MKISRVLPLVVAAFALLVPFVAAPSAHAQGHPDYLHALSSLRTARDYLQADRTPGIGDAKHHAISEIDKAIADIKHAAWDDGKNTNYAPPPSGITDPWTLLRQAHNWIYKARGQVSTGTDNPVNIGYRDDAITHINLAMQAVDAVVPPR